MRALDLSGVACEICAVPVPQDRWGKSCGECGFASFRVELVRSASGLNGENYLDALVNSATSGTLGGELGLLLDLATDDVGGPGITFSTRNPLVCSGVSSLEVSEFLSANVDDRTRKYVAWKRREVEASLPEGYRICARCRVSFKAFDNAWGRAGLCSKACYKAFMKSWEGDA